MIILHSIYGVACNKCGKGCPMVKGDTAYFEDAQAALSNAARWGWQIINPNLALCPECAAQEKNGEEPKEVPNEQ